jgi:hypothetical protein
MAIFREIPKCIYCGEPIAKAIYRDISKIPFGMQMIGDNFIKWEFIKHECKKDNICINHQPINKKLIKYFEKLKMKGNV